MIQQSYSRRDINSPFHMEREVQPLSRNPNFQSTIAVYIFWKVGKQFKKKKEKNPYLPTLILKTMQSETHIFFCLAQGPPTLAIRDLIQIGYLV